jgi:hypothetical protein
MVFCSRRYLRIDNIIKIVQINITIIIKTLSIIYKTIKINNIPYKIMIINIKMFKFQWLILRLWSAKYAKMIILSINSFKIDSS